MSWGHILGMGGVSNKTHRFAVRECFGSTSRLVSALVVLEDRGWSPVLNVDNYGCTSQHGLKPSAARSSVLFTWKESTVLQKNIISNTWSQSKFWRFLFRKRDFFLYCKNMVFDCFFGFWTYEKSETRYQKEALLSRSLLWISPYSEPEINWLLNCVWA